MGYAIEDDDPARETDIEDVLFVSNASDRSVNESFGYDVIITRLGPLTPRVDFYEYDKPLGFAHDLIDPDGMNAEKIDEIYAELYPLLGLPVETTGTAE